MPSNGRTSRSTSSGSSTSTIPSCRCGFARITHLMDDPKEREPVNQQYVRWWVMQHAHRAVREFEESTKKEQLIPPGSPIDFVPKSGAGEPDRVKHERSALILETRRRPPGHGLDSRRHFPDGLETFYREERPVRAETVPGFWLDRTPVTNAEFSEFVDATGYITLCERPPDPAAYPDADPALLVPGSAVFRRPSGPVSLSDSRAWWEYVPGANWRHPQGPDSSDRRPGRSSGRSRRL